MSLVAKHNRHRQSLRLIIQVPALHSVSVSPPTRDLGVLLTSRRRGALSLANLCPASSGRSRPLDFKHNERISFLSDRACTTSLCRYLRLRWNFLPTSIVASATPHLSSHPMAGPLYSRTQVFKIFGREQSALQYWVRRSEVVPFLKFSCI